MAESAPVTDDLTTQLLRVLADAVATAVADRLERLAAVEQKPPRVLLTVSEAAQRLSISRTSMYALVGSGEVESVLIGRLRRVPATAVEEYVGHLRSSGQDRSTSL